jgi:TRAP-type mannitol/chloroaromatic compound transport system permease small subunit
MAVWQFARRLFFWTAMKPFFAFAHVIDAVNNFFAMIAKWSVILCVFISALNAIVRYTFSYSSNAWIEIQWYLFTSCVMLGAAQVFRVNEHVRVDVIYGTLSSTKRIWIDIFGLTLFLLPGMAIFAYLSWPMFWGMYLSGEMSSNTGGLIRWPVVLMLPLGFTLVWLQGWSELIKRIGWLLGQYEMDLTYERPLQ